jgi:hypothetical protein
VPGIRRVSILALACVAVFVGGCVTGSGGREVSFRGSENAPGLTITIRNQRADDIRFWIWIEGRRETLGTVRSNATQTFRKRMDLVSMVRLEFDITLGPTCVTRTVSLEPGARLDVTIPVNLRLIDARCG